MATNEGGWQPGDEVEQRMREGIRRRSRRKRRTRRFISVIVAGAVTTVVCVAIRIVPGGFALWQIVTAGFLVGFLVTMSFEYGIYRE